MRWLATILIGFICFFGYSQSLDKKTFKKLFLDAEYYFLFENYNKALDIYLDIWNRDSLEASHNSNLNYKIGFCYLNDPIQKYKAYPFLERATKNISFDYPVGTYREINAPIEVWQLLGDAYRCNFEFDKAIEAYNRFLEVYYLYKSKLAIEEDLYNEVSIMGDIQACMNAKELLLISAHNTVRVSNLGPTINTQFPEYNPVVSGDESTMLFTGKRTKEKKRKSEDSGLKMDDYIEEIFYTRRVGNEWLSPINISQSIAADNFTTSVSLSYDGKQLFVSKIEILPGNIETSNIYVSRLNPAGWTELVKLNKNINTKAFEANAYLCKDGRTLYFTSDREGGYGGVDIYCSKKDETGDWGPAVNLGDVINTPLNEEYPFVLEDEKIIFFSSQGHYNMGGYDIFYSRVDEKNNWMTPINMGFPINSMEDNMFLMPVQNGNIFYSALIAKEGYGDLDIYRMTTSSNSDDSWGNQYYDLAQIRHENYGLTSGTVLNYLDEVPEKLNENITAFEIINENTSMSTEEVVDASKKDIDKLRDIRNDYKKSSEIAFSNSNKILNDLNEMKRNGVKESDPNFRKKELEALSAYNTSVKLTQALAEIDLITENMEKLNEDLKSQTDQNPEMARTKLNNSREQANNASTKWYNLEKDIAQTSKELSNKSKAISNYVDNYNIVNQNIHKYNSDIDSLNAIINHLKTVAAETTNRKEAKSLLKSSEKYAAEKNELVGKLEKEKSKKVNLATDMTKFDKEIESIDIRIKALNSIILATGSISDQEAEELRKNIGPEDEKILADFISDKKASLDHTTVYTRPVEDTIADTYFAELAVKAKQYETKAENLMASNYAEIETSEIISQPDVSESVLATSNNWAETKQKFLPYIKYMNFEVQFEKGTMNPDKESTSALNELADLMRIYPEMKYQFQFINDSDLNEQKLKSEKVKSIIEERSLSSNRLNNKTPDNLTANVTVYLEGQVLLVGNTDTKTTESNNSDSNAGNAKDITQDNTVETKTETGTKTETMHDKTETSTYISADNQFSTNADKSVTAVRDVLFDLDKASTEKYYENMNILAEYLKSNPDARICITGYTDLLGDEEYNKLLSLNRAKFIKAYLVDQGADSKSICTKGAGEEKQIAVDLSPETRKYNRRAEIEVTRQGKEKLVILPVDMPKEYRIKNL